MEDIIFFAMGFMGGAIGMSLIIHFIVKPIFNWVEAIFIRRKVRRWDREREAKIASGKGFVTREGYWVQYKD